MEQRPLRLGDILDDYCPRERRVTNHAVVAMIEEDVRQTRCTTCDAEHPYKGGKAPRRRVKKESPAALYKEVLAGMSDIDAVPSLATPATVQAPESSTPSPADTSVDAGDTADAERPFALNVQELRAQRSEVVAERAASSRAEEAVPPQAEDGVALPSAEEGPVHRPLIRATLPRPEGQKEVRAIPDFTIRQPMGRGRFRGGDGRVRARGGNATGGGNGNRAGGGPRFGGPRAGGRRNRSR